MDLPSDLPHALNLADAKLQRLQFEEPRPLANRVESIASYEAKTLTEPPVRVDVRASAHADDIEDLKAATAKIYAAFEVHDLDAELDRFEPEEDAGASEAGPESESDRDVLFEVALVSPSAKEASGQVVSFVIDPVPISKNETPHRWKPENSQTVWVWMRIDAGDATMRVFRGSNPTDRFRRRATPGWTKGLKADVDTPRVRVNGHQNGTSYDLSGGWKQI